MPISLGGRGSRQRCLWADAELVALGVGHDVPGVRALAVRLQVGRPAGHELLPHAVDVISAGDDVDVYSVLDRLLFGHLLEDDSLAGRLAELSLWADRRGAAPYARPTMNLSVVLGGVATVDHRLDEVLAGWLHDPAECLGPPVGLDVGVAAVDVDLDPEGLRHGNLLDQRPLSRPGARAYGQPPTSDAERDTA